MKAEKEINKIGKKEHNMTFIIKTPFSELPYYLKKNDNKYKKGNADNPYYINSKDTAPSLSSVIKL